MRPADTSTELMQLRESEAIGPIDDDCIRARHIDTAFDNCRAHEDMNSPVIKIEHDLFEVMLAHLAVCDLNRRVGNDFLYLAGIFFDVFDAIVDKVELSATLKLPLGSLAHQRRIPFSDERFDRQP